MADAMISYSRKDAAFVQKLHDALIATGRDTWVDWEDIPKTAAWWEEVKRGIEESSNFIFVISPDSISSKVCFDEVEHAVTHNKRFVPILFRDIENVGGAHNQSKNPLENAYAKLGFESTAEQVVARISPHNWIFFREDTDFDTAFAELLQALETDLDYVNLHTRLLVRAREWERGNRATDLVLRGGDLRTAETWLQHASKPEPSPLHHEYIRASRRFANTQRRTAIVTTGVIIIIIVLAILAVLQAINANEQSRIAAEQAAIATIAQGQALIEANNARNSADYAATAQAQAEQNAQAALIAQEQALIEADNARNSADYAATAQAQAEQNAQTALIAQQQAVSQALIAQEEREKALVARTVSERNAAELQSLLLAFNAQQVLNVNNVELAALLAKEALNIENPPADAIRTFAQAIYTPGGTRRLFGGHNAPVTSLAIAPDGNTFYSASCGSQDRLTDHCNSGVILVWQPDGNILARWSTDAHTQEINSLALSEDGNTLLSASVDGKIVVWDVPSGTPRLTFSGHEDAVNVVVISPDGQQALSASCYKRSVENACTRSQILLWKIADGTIVRDLREHRREVLSLAFAPDPRYALSGSADNTVIYWNLQTETVLRRLVDHTDWVNGVAFSPDGRYALTASSDSRILLWDINGGNPIQTLNGHLDGVTSIAFSPDGQHVLSGSKDNTLILWDLASGTTVLHLIGHQDDITSAAFSPNGQHVLSASLDTTLRYWDLQDTTSRLLTLEEGVFQAAAFSPDANYVLGATCAEVVAGACPNPRLALWETRSGTLIHDLSGHTNWVTALAISPDGSQALSGSDDNTMILWDMTTGEKRYQFGGHGNWVTSVAFSPVDTVVFSGSADTQIVQWDTTSGAARRVFPGHQSAVEALAISPDGRLLASASDVILLHDPITGGLIARLSPEMGARSLAFNSTGTQLLAGMVDGSIRLWDTSSGDLLMNLYGHSDWVLDVNYSPGEDTMLSAAADGSVIVWNTANGELIRHLQGHNRAVLSSVYSPSGGEVFTLDSGAGLRLWQISVSNLLAWAEQNRYLRGFTCEERERFRVEPLCEPELIAEAAGDAGESAPSSGVIASIATLQSQFFANIGLPDTTDDDGFAIILVDAPGYEAIIAPDSRTHLVSFVRQGNEFCYLVGTRQAAEVSTVTWTPRISVTGNYEIEVFIPGTNATASAAVYSIYGILDQEEPVTYTLNQLNFADTWVSLGVYELDGLHPLTGRVALSNRLDVRDLNTAQFAFGPVRWTKVAD